MNISGKAPWLDDTDVKVLLNALNNGGNETRVIGGAVRNFLLQHDAGDIDFATTLLPDETIACVEKASFKAVPTGYAHGTITAVKNGRAFEITTLRQDIATNGRHAEVAFGKDWTEDAKRRDFSINALSCDAFGNVFDYCGGLADIETRTIRFIGDAETRIREDTLRSLRFYRFFALYGSGRPDSNAIRATAKLKAGLAQLSAERVWAELKKLLSAPDPSRALLWMRQAGVLTAVLPESENWGIDSIPGLIAAEQSLGWQADPMLRLMAITPSDKSRIEALATRLRFSKIESERMVAHASTAKIDPETSELAMAKRLYLEGRSGVFDQLNLALAAARAKALLDDAAMINAAKFSRLLDFVKNWQMPVFPVSGKDLKAKGFVEGPDMGSALAEMEKRWIDSGFKLTQSQLLD